MGHSLQGNDALANTATRATYPLLRIADSGAGGDAGRALLNYMYSADTSMGELEVRLALGALATALLDAGERLARLEARS